jgi:hypothetical protein
MRNAARAHDERSGRGLATHSCACRRKLWPIRIEMRDRGEDRRTPGFGGMKAESVMLVVCSGGGVRIWRTPLKNFKKDSNFIQILFKSVINLK